MGKKTAPPAVLQSAGGIPFFITLFCLLILSSVNFWGLLPLLGVETVFRWRYFAGGACFGAFLAQVLLKHESRIFVHELKHSIISNLVGNRDKGISVRRRGGFFQYKYTRSTAKYNALIALAPYFLPLFTIVMLLAFLFPAVRANLHLGLLLLGFAYGADLVMNLRDLSIRQSDLIGIRGGVVVGFLFVVAMNWVIFSYLAAWICQGWLGLEYLLACLGEVVYQIVGIILTLRKIKNLGHPSNLAGHKVTWTILADFITESW